jgi:hypothetical protein
MERTAKRDGPGRPPGPGPTREEMDERIDQTVKLLARRLFTSDIKRVLMAKYDVCARTCETYISRARELILEWSGKSKEEHRQDALALFESVVRSDAPAKERMEAQAHIVALLGLAAREGNGRPSVNVLVNVWDSFAGLPAGQVPDVIEGKIAEAEARSEAG